MTTRLLQLVSVLCFSGAWGSMLAAGQAQAGPAAAGRAEAYYHYVQAQLYEGAGNHPAALSEYEAALRLEPGSSQILVDYAAALADVGRTEDAEKTAVRAVEADPDNVEAHLLLGNIFRTRIRENPAARDKAVSEYQTVLRLDPENWSALASLARLHLAGGQYSEAEKLLETLTGRQPEAADELFLLAVTQSEQQKLERALETLDRVGDLNPAHARAWALRGSIHERRRDIDSAIAAYQGFLKLRPDDADIKRRLASLLVEKGKTGDATSMLQELAERNPFDASVLLELGKARRDEKQYAEALKNFRAAARVEADNPEVAYWLAVTLAETGERKEALSILKKALDGRESEGGQQRARPLMLTQMGLIQQDDLQYDAAVATFTQLERDYADDFRPALYLAGAYRLKREWNRAAEVIARARSRFPSERSLLVAEAQVASHRRGLESGLRILDAEIRRLEEPEADGADAALQMRLNRAQIQAEHRAFSDAEAELLRLEKEYPDNEMVRFQLGAVYERQKKFKRAEEIFRALLAERPDNAMVLNYLGYMWADRGENLQQALELVRKAVALDPFNGAYLDSLGWAQFKLNDLQGAQENLAMAARIVPGDATIREHLGDLYDRLGNYDLALQAYQEALQALRLSPGPDSGEHEEERVREKIKRLGKLTRGK